MEIPCREMEILPLGQPRDNPGTCFLCCGG
jgi:hypothetical protein